MIDNIPIFVNQELGKIPLDIVSTFAWLQELVYRSSTLTIHIDLYPNWQKY